MAKFIIRSSFTVLAAWLALGAGVAHAQDYPSRPITVINSFAPGGNADIVLRLVAARLSTDLGQPVVVDNRPGANGVIAADAVARARPDGYTLLLVSGAYPTLVATSKSLPFDPVQGFSWISMLITYPLAIAVPADSPFKTLSDLVAAAKAAPGRLNYSSAGVGSLFHLATESFESSAGIDMTHVPYKGGAAPLTELLSGSRLDLTFNTLSVVEPIMKAGRVRVLAMTSATRSPLLPDVPVVAESYPGYEASSFLGIAGPAGMAPAVIERLNQALHRVLATPEMRQRFADLGGTPLPDSSEHMRRVIQSETARWKDIVATKKIDIQ